MRQTTTYALSFKLQRETCKIDPRSTGMIVFNNAFSEITNMFACCHVGGP